MILPLPDVFPAHRDNTPAVALAYFLLRPIDPGTDGEDGNDGWLGRAARIVIAPFPNRVGEDKDAVRAAIASQGSNGEFKGRIRKIKLAQRQIYGRDKIDLF